MRKDIIKAYDIIVENQRNADRKAHIFIVVLSAFLTFMNDIPLSSFPESQKDSIIYIFYITLLPLLFFLLSLIPKYNNNFNLKILIKNELKLNIFYWKSIINTHGVSELIQEYQERYQVKELSNLERDILSQIFTNANILEYKRRLHSFAFFFLNQFMIIISVSILGLLIIGNRPYLIFAILVLAELFFILSILNISIFTAVKKFIKNIFKKQ